MNFHNGKRIMPAVYLCFALLLAFSCADLGRDNPNDPGSNKYDPSLITYEGETYKIVPIGEQTWMARNLNYNVSGSRCYDDDPTNCTTYGRLYDWTTAMNLPSNCNSSTCASQVNKKHKGICPSGWHIPSDSDWNVLMKFVNYNCSDNSTCAGAGTKLKAASGWNSYSGIPAGTDDFGFSALPGGYGNSDGSFFNVGYGGDWWTASEGNADSAYGRSMYYGNEDVYYYLSNKGYLRSVRCVKN